MIFCPLFADLASATDPALPMLASRRDYLTLRIVGAMMFLLDLACYTKASGKKVRAKVLLPSFFFDDYLGKYGRYQFPPYLYQEL
jgi:hypothetical protein